MATLTPDTQRLAHDEFERYYAEKIWEWIPGIYRHEDGIAINPDVLRAIVEIVAKQAAVTRRSIDRLWEDEFIDFCDDWAISYIGDLLGTRPVHALNRRGRRVDVAKTIFYRKRKGTPLVMETLIRDITGWEGVVVESFRRLTRMRHGLDPEPTGLEGLITGTPPGGLAALTQPRGGDLIDGPFDEYLHTPDFRQLRGFKGRYNIPKLNFHLYRLLPFKVTLATPFDFGIRRYTCDPSGRDSPLYRPCQRPDPEDWQPVHEWQIPAPIPSELLKAASYKLETNTLPNTFEHELRQLIGEQFVNEARLRETLQPILDPLQVDPATFDAAIANITATSITENSPKGHLIPEAIAVLMGNDNSHPPFPHQVVLSTNLKDWGLGVGTTTDKKIMIDLARGRFLLLEDPSENEQVFVPHYFYGFSGPLGAGTYDRRHSVATESLLVPPIDDQIPDDPGPITGFSLPTNGIQQFNTSKTYIFDASTDHLVNNIKQLCLQAKNQERPYIKLAQETNGREWEFRAEDKSSEAEHDTEDNLRLLTLEGLWIGIVPQDLPTQSLSTPEESCEPVATTLILDGFYDRVVIQHCTIDPGGEQARLLPCECTPIPFVAIEIRGQVQELIIESSIVSEIRESTSTTDPCSVGTLTIRDSIVHSLGPDQHAILTRIGEVHLERTTVFGNISVNRLYATEALIQGVVRVVDNQHGCFRFSATHDDATKRLPPQFESHIIRGGIPNHFFVSRRFGDPGYAQLSETVPDEIVRGAENGSEIGAFQSLFNPIKRDDLQAKVNEFMPFGLIAQYINET